MTIIDKRQEFAERRRETISQRHKRETQERVMDWLGVNRQIDEHFRQGLRLVDPKDPDGAA